MSNDGGSTGNLPAGERLRRLGLECVNRIRMRPGDFLDAAQFIESQPDGPEDDPPGWPRHFGPVLHKLAGPRQLVEKYRARASNHLYDLTIQDARRIILFCALVFVPEFTGSVLGLHLPWRQSSDSGIADGRAWAWAGVSDSATESLILVLDGCLAHDEAMAASDSGPLFKCDPVVTSLATPVHHMVLWLGQLAMSVSRIERDLEAEHRGSLPEFAVVQMAQHKKLALHAWNELKAALPAAIAAAPSAFAFIRDHHLKPTGWDSEVNAAILSVETMVREAVNTPWGGVAGKRWWDACLRLQSLRDELASIPAMPRNALAVPAIGESRALPQYEAYREILTCPLVRDARDAVQASLLSLRWDYVAQEGDDEQRVASVRRALEPHRARYLTDAIGVLDFGFAAFEVVWAVDAHLLRVVGMIKPLAPDLTEALVDETGNWCGLSNLGVRLDAGSAIWMHVGEPTEVGLVGYGRSRLHGVRSAFSAWKADPNNENAAKALRHAYGEDPATAAKLVGALCETELNRLSASLLTANFGPQSSLSVRIRCCLEGSPASAGTSTTQPDIADLVNDAKSQIANAARAGVHRVKRSASAKVDDEIMLAQIRAGLSLRDAAEALTARLGRKVTKKMVEGAVERAGGHEAVLDSANAESDRS